MIVLNLDSEQAMMVLIAAEASNAILKARLHRVDPDKVISNSAILQDHKITQLKEQIAAGQLSRWTDLNSAEKEEFMTICFGMAEAAGNHECEGFYDALTAFILLHRAKRIEIGIRQSLGRG